MYVQPWTLHFFSPNAKFLCLWIIKEWMALRILMVFLIKFWRQTTHHRLYVNVWRKIQIRIVNMLIRCEPLYIYVLQFIVDAFYCCVIILFINYFYPIKKKFILPSLSFVESAFCVATCFFFFRKRSEIDRFAKKRFFFFLQIVLFRE